MSEEMTREETKVKTFDVLRFIADNAGLSIFEAIEKAYNMGLSEQEPKTGHWKQISPARIYECDICGQNVMTDDISAYRYCHGCGAKMESEGAE